MKKVTVKQMLEELTEALVTQKEPKTYYWERENFNTGNLEMVEITEVDLLRDRFKTIDDDFHYYEYELQDSHIYRKE